MATAASLISLLAQEYMLQGVPIAVVCTIASASNGCDKLITLRALNFAL